MNAQQAINLNIILFCINFSVFFNRIYLENISVKNWDKKVDSIRSAFIAINDNAIEFLVVLSGFGPNSVGEFALPLSIGRIYGWLMLAILSGWALINYGEYFRFKFNHLFCYRNMDNTPYQTFLETVTAFDKMDISKKLKNI